MNKYLKIYWRIYNVHSLLWCVCSRVAISPIIWWWTFTRTLTPVCVQGGALKTCCVHSGAPTESCAVAPLFHQAKPQVCVRYTWHQGCHCFKPLGLCFKFITKQCKHFEVNIIPKGSFGSNRMMVYNAYLAQPKIK